MYLGDPAGQPAKVRVMPGLPGGYAFTALVVQQMRTFARAALHDERVHQLARQITVGVGAHDKSGAARAILAWVLENIRYTPLPWSPDGFQRVQEAPYTLFVTQSGECASLSVACAALCMAMGIEVRFRSAGRDPENPRDFEHVLVAVNLGGERWFSADPSSVAGHAGDLGWTPPDARVFQDWLM